MSRGERKPDVRKTYALAWSDRATLGTSEDVLAARLREAGMDKLAEPDSPVFELWRREVAPNRFTWELIKIGGNALVGVADAGLAIYRAFRDDEDFEFEIPKGKRQVSDEIQNDVELDLVFERGDATDEAFAQAMQARGSLRGWRMPTVWLEMLPTVGRARVLMGEHEVGQTEVPRDAWKHARAAERDGLYADGFLQVRPVRGGGYETGDMSCFFAPEAPVLFDE